MRLLNRTTRSVTPTEAGERLLERLAPALGEIDSALDVVNSFRESPRGVLRLNVPAIVAVEILPPIVAVPAGLSGRQARNRRRTNVSSTWWPPASTPASAMRSGIELDMIAAPIGPRVQRFVVAAAPSYLAQRGTPTHPRDLVNHACIRHRFASGATPDWEFTRGDEVVRIKPDGPLIASTIELELSAAVAGLGIVCTFEELLRGPLERGELQPVLADWPQTFSGPFLYYPSRNMPAPLRAFVDFVRKYDGEDR